MRSEFQVSSILLIYGMVALMLVLLVIFHARTAPLIVFLVVFLQDLTQ